MAKLKRTKKPKKGNPKGERRYPEGRFRVYDETYDLKLKRSPILNAEAREKDIRHSAALLDEDECKTTLLQLVGNPKKDYHYLEEGGWKVALIPNAITNLRKIQSRFKEWQKKQVRDGFALEKPKEWPRDLLEKRLKAEAILDIYRRERSKVEQVLERHKANREKEREANILEYGPQGKGLRHDPRSIRPWLVDGQRVSRNTDEVPYIDEPSSPYHLMPLVHYRKMASDWIKHLRKLAKERHQKRVEEAKAKGETPPGSSSWRRIKVSKDELPDWPDGAKKITELE